MTVSLSLQLDVTGDGETERSIREHAAWLGQRQHTPEYHDMMGHIALTLARSHWREADRLREAARDRAARRPRAKTSGEP